MQVAQFTPGCVSLTIELDEPETQRLFTAVENGSFRQYDLIDARITGVQISPPELEFWPTYTRGVSCYAVPRAQVAEVVNSPTLHQHILCGRTVPFEDSRCSLYAKHFPSSSDPYTVLVLSMFHRAHRAVGLAVRVYEADVEHSRDWQPLQLLEAFLNKYGVDETYEGIGTRRLFVAVPLSIPGYFAQDEAVAIAYVHTLRRPSSNNRIGDVEFLNLHFYEHQTKSVFIELAFGIALRRYVTDLLRHGLSIPSHFLERTPGHVP
jgi:hypothetical protein